MSIGLGSDWATVNVALTTVYAEVTHTRKVRGFRLQARGENDIRHKRLSTDTNYVTIKGGSNHPYEIVLLQETPSLGFFATSTGTETLEGIVFF